MKESFVRCGIEISVLSTVVIIPVRALAGGAGAELGKFYNLRWIGDVVEAHTAKSLVLLALVIEMWVVVLAHGRFESRICNRRLRSCHENPFFQVFVVGHLDLAAFKSAFVVKGRLSNVTDVDHVALLEHVPAVSDGQKLHLAVT